MAFDLRGKIRPRLASSVVPPRRAPIRFIILPLIDVVFLLLLFFVMVTSFEDNARISVELPNPDASQARPGETSRQVVITCQRVGEGNTDPTASCRIAANPPEPLDAIGARLAAARAANPDVTVAIRADRRLTFLQVQPILRLAADRGITNVQVAAMSVTGP